MPDRVGQQLGNYRLTRFIDEGGFAEVYLGEHIYLGTEAAIKVMTTRFNQNELDQFRDEARMIARLKHQHIIRILEFGIDDRTPYLVMDYAPGGTLRKRYASGPRPTPKQLVPYILQVATALQYAHDQKLIHRDIKPENILLEANEHILLSDFGIAVAAHSSKSLNTQNSAGTIYYMAPEQIQGKPRPASDQYSLAVVIYELLCGSRPFSGTSWEVFAQHLTAPPAPMKEKIASISPEIEAVIMKALTKDPHERYGSVMEFAKAFEATCVEKRVVEPPLPAWMEALKKPVIQSSLPSSVETLGRPKEERAVVEPPLPAWMAVVEPPLPAWMGDLRAPNEEKQSAPSSPPLRPKMPIGTLLLTYKRHSFPIRSISWSPDGTKIASSSGDKTVQIWNVQTGKNLQTMNHQEQVSTVAWSPNGKYVVAGDDEGMVKVWDSVTGQNIQTYKGHTAWIKNAAWSPDGMFIASGSNDNTIRIWNVATGKQLLVYQKHGNFINGIAWSHDGKFIVSSEYGSGKIHIWNTRTGNTKYVYRGHSNSVWIPSWSPDGTRISTPSSDKTVQIWDAKTGRIHVTYKGHTNSVYTASWSPDGRYIASSGAGMKEGVQIWDAGTGKHIFTYMGHSGYIQPVAWSPDGTRVASGGGDKTVQVWWAVP